MIGEFLGWLMWLQGRLQTRSLNIYPAWGTAWGFSTSQKEFAQCHASFRTVGANQ